MWCEAHEFSTKPSNIHKFGKEYCEKHMAEAEAKLVRAAREAHLDRHGNPLDGSDGLKLDPAFKLHGYQKKALEFIQNNPTSTITPI